MNHLRRFPFLCFLLAVFAIGGFCLVDQEFELLVVAGVLAGISWFVTEGPRGRTLPRWVSNVLVLAFLVNMILDAQSAPSQLPSVLGRFTVWLTLIKLYERRHARDHGQLMGLSLLLMLIGASRTPPPLLFGIILVLYAALGLYCVLVYQLYSAHERSRRLRHTRGLEGVVPDRPTIGRHVGGQLRGVAVLAGFAIAAVSVGIFLLFPRQIGRGFLRPITLEQGRVDSVTGLGDQIDLETGTRISDDPTVLFTVRTIPPPGVPSPGAVGRTMLLRAAALERYEGGRWGAGEAGFVEVRSRPGSAVTVIPADVSPPDPPTASWWQRFEFVRDASQLLHLGGPMRIRIDEGVRTIDYVQATRALRVARRGGGRGTVRSVEIRSIPEPGPEVLRALAGGGRDDFGIRGIMTNRTSRTRRLIRLAAREVLEPRGLWPPPTPFGVVPPAEWAESAAEAFDDHFRVAGFVYTLDLSDVPATTRRSGENDPVVRFLRETRRGHCEYFASAFSLLCQSVGIEARVVIGFAASEWDPDRGVHLVRARHAHAWSEVHLGQWTWRTFDPTPPSVTLATNTPDVSVADRLGSFYDRLEGTWNDRFVGYDPGLQSEVFDALERSREATLGETWRDLMDWAGSVNRAFRLGVAGYVWLGIVAFAGLIALIALLRWIRRRMRVARGLGLGPGGAFAGGRTIAALAFYVDLLDVMRRGGEGKPEWQTPMHWAAVVGRRRPELAGTLRDLVELYYEGRFGGRLPDPETIRGAETAVATVAGVLSKRPGRRPRRGSRS